MAYDRNGLAPVLPPGHFGELSRCGPPTAAGPSARARMLASQRSRSNSPHASQIRRTARGRGSCRPSRPVPIPKAGSAGAWSAWTRPRAELISMPRVPVPTRLLSLDDAASHPGQRRPDEALGRFRGGLTCKIHLAGEGDRRPLPLVITPGPVGGDAPQLIPVLERIRILRPGGGHSRTCPDRLGGDEAYSSRQNRRHLRRRQIKHTTPERKGRQANRQRRRPTCRLRQEGLRTPQRSRANDQRPQGLPCRSHPIRPKGVCLPRHRDRRRPSSLDSLMTHQTVLRRPRTATSGSRRDAIAPTGAPTSHRHRSPGPTDRRSWP